jgi:hypothetical protein
MSRVPSRLVAAVVAVTSGLAACSLSLLSGERPVISLGAAAAALVAGAALTGWRWLGSAAVGGAAATVLLAAAVSPDRIGAGHLLAASGLLILLVAALDQVDRSAYPPGTVVLVRPPVRRLLAVPLLAAAAAALVALAATRPVAPSVALAVLGLMAGLAALLVSTAGL